MFLLNKFENPEYARACLEALVTGQTYAPLTLDAFCDYLEKCGPTHSELLAFWCWYDWYQNQFEELPATVRQRVPLPSKLYTEAATESTIPEEQGSSSQTGQEPSIDQETLDRTKSRKLPLHKHVRYAVRRWFPEPEPTNSLPSASTSTHPKERRRPLRLSLVSNLSFAWDGDSLHSPSIKQSNATDARPSSPTTPPPPSPSTVLTDRRADTFELSVFESEASTTTSQKMPGLPLDPALMDYVRCMAVLTTHPSVFTPAVDACIEQLAMHHLPGFVQQLIQNVTTRTIQTRIFLAALAAFGCILGIITFIIGGFGRLWRIPLLVCLIFCIFVIVTHYYGICNIKMLRHCFKRRKDPVRTTEAQLEAGNRMHTFKITTVPGQTADGANRVKTLQRRICYRIVLITLILSAAVSALTMIPPDRNYLTSPQ